MDLSEDLLKLTRRADIVFWPLAMDARRKDVERLEEGEIDLVLINGAVRLHEQAHMARLLRKKSKVVVAHGTCAHLGGIVGLGNFHTARTLLSRSFEGVSSVKNPEGILPGISKEDSGDGPALTGLFDRVMTLDQVVDVDYYIPGCPPPPELVADLLWAALDGGLPEKGYVSGDRKALCHGCPRFGSRPERIAVEEFKRVHETEWDSEECFLPQGLICLGPATRGGCGSRCINANMPCRGCFGPLDHVEDHGAAVLSLIASTMDGEHENEIRRMVASVPDVGGLLYRYSAPGSILGRGRETEK